jgi:8-oxo-dGTP pyrophosphatase MutT (NUDIX family)
VIGDGGNPAVDVLPWLDRPPDERRLTVAQVLAACADLPAPKHVELFPDLEPRPAGLLVPLTEIGGEAHLLLTKRAAGLVHRDDWVFPGGGLDPDADRTTADSARREASEELGVALDAIEVVGQLDTYGPIITGYVIDVFVGLIAPGTVLAPDAREVAETLALPLAWFTADGAFERRMMVSDFNPDPFDATPLPPSLIGPFAAFAVRPDEWLWGMQANVLCQFLSHLYA